MGFIVKPLRVEDRLPLYDVVLCAAGFETRARYLASALELNARQKAAIGFPDRQEIAYRQNVDWFKGAQFLTSIVADEEFGAYIHTVLEAATRDSLEPIAACVDISSFSRFRLARIVNAFRELGLRRTCRAHFLYNLADYADPPRNVLAVNAHAGPVMAEFAGWSAGPELPPVALVGLGYEEGKALGAVEYLQADEIWAFDPFSPIEPYRKALKQANELLIELVPTSRMFPYEVMDPFNLFARLEALVFAVKSTARPHILPFGPKIFTLMSLLVATLHREAAVWRVSAGPAEPAFDRQPSKWTVAVEVEFSPTPKHRRGIGASKSDSMAL